MLNSKRDSTVDERYLHRPRTAQALEDIFRRADAGTDPPSDDERLLVAAAEFWAMTRSRSLVRYLRREPEIRLAVAHCAFKAIYAAHVVQAIEIAMVRIRFEPADDHAGILRRLQRLLEHSPDDVDGALEAYAKQLLARRLFSVVQ